jgi:hypothetical protein
MAEMGRPRAQRVGAAGGGARVLKIRIIGRRDRGRGAAALFAGLECVNIVQCAK